MRGREPARPVDREPRAGGGRVRGPVGWLEALRGRRGRWVAAGATDPGRVRARNEDAFGLIEDPPLWVVADGMGGHRAGDRASGVAVEALIRFFRGATGLPVAERLAAAVGAAHGAVVADAREDPARAGMGCTLVAAAVAGPTLHVCHAGDARCYVGRGTALEPVTRDHSAVAELGLAEGRALRHPMRNVVTRAVGVSLGGGASCATRRLRGVDRVLLCTDGLWALGTRQELAGILASAPDPAGACRDLIAFARARGAPDNVTALVAFRRR